MKYAVSAYTLVEVLVAVSIFSAVSLGAVSVVSSMAQADRLRQSSALVNGSVGQAIRFIEQDVQYVSRGNPGINTQVVDLTDTPVVEDMVQKDTALYLKRAVSSEEGSATAATDQYLYCSLLLDQTGTVTGKRLARISLPASAVMPTSIASGSRKCSLSAIASIFGVSQSSLAVFYMTGETVETMSFQVWPVWSSSWPAPGDYLVNPPLVRVEITARPRATVAGVDDRASRSKTTLPIIVRRDIPFLSSKFTYEAP